MKTGPRDTGQATVMVAGMMLVCFAVAGVALDGTRAFLLRRNLQSAADGAALAGTGRIDRAAFYRSDGEVVRLDPDAARDRALDWLEGLGIAGRVVVEATPDEVTVVLRGEVAPALLALAGVGPIPVVVEARSGIVIRDP